MLWVIRQIILYLGPSTHHLGHMYTLSLWTCASEVSEVDQLCVATDLSTIAGNLTSNNLCEPVQPTPTLAFNNSLDNGQSQYFQSNTDQLFDFWRVQYRAARFDPWSHKDCSRPFDIAFHRSIDNDYAKNVNICSEKALCLTNRLLAWTSNESSSRSRQGKGKARLDSEDDVIDKFGSIVLDVLGQLSERAVNLSSYPSLMSSILRRIAV